jgi:hypothetical protein
MGLGETVADNKVAWPSLFSSAVSADGAWRSLKGPVTRQWYGQIKPWDWLCGNVDANEVESEYLVAESQREQLLLRDTQP